MTMQVAMVGTDGIVLASDLLWADNNQKIRTSQLSPKIKLSPRRDVAVSFARSMETSGPIADAILRLDDSAWENPIQSLREAANSIISLPTIGRKDAHCLIVSAKPKLCAYFLRVAQVATGCWQPMCQEVIGYAWAGDDNNPAVFWVKRYYVMGRPVASLLPLAAQLITSASEVNSAAIGGLQIAICSAANFRFLDSDSIAQLEQRAKSLGERIGDSFYDDMNTAIPFRTAQPQPEHGE